MTFDELLLAAPTDNEAHEALGQVLLARVKEHLETYSLTRAVLGPPRDDDPEPYATVTESGAVLATVSQEVVVSTRPSYVVPEGRFTDAGLEHQVDEWLRVCSLELWMEEDKRLECLLQMAADQAANLVYDEVTPDLLDRLCRALPGEVPPRKFLFNRRQLADLVRRLEGQIVPETDRRAIMTGLRGTWRDIELRVGGTVPAGTIIAIGPRIGCFESELTIQAQPQWRGWSIDEVFRMWLHTPHVAIARRKMT